MYIPVTFQVLPTYTASTPHGCQQSTHRKSLFHNRSWKIFWRQRTYPFLVPRKISAIFVLHSSRAMSMKLTIASTLRKRTKRELARLMTKKKLCKTKITLLLLWMYRQYKLVPRQRQVAFTSRHALTCTIIPYITSVLATSCATSGRRQMAV